MEKIPNTFLSHACDILGDKDLGISTSQIVKLLSGFSVEYNVDIPHSKTPIEAPNKRTALLDNLQCFNSEQQYKIISDLCIHPTQCNREEVKNLNRLLKQRYGMLNKESATFDQALSEDTSHWLSKYPDSLHCYLEALSKRRQGMYGRNLLDDLRLSLELLLKSVLNNNKSLENQIQLLGAFIADKGGSKDFTNMFTKLVDYFSTYQNNYVKHNDHIIESEIDFIVDITSAFMKAICRHV